MSRHRWTKTGLRAERDAAVAKTRKQQTTIDRLQQQLGAERKARAADAMQAKQEVARLQMALRAWESQWANEHPITVPAGHRAVDPDDQPTHPVDVRTLRQAFAEFGPVIPIKVPAAATSPTHVPVRAAETDDETTQQLAAVRQHERQVA